MKGNGIGATTTSAGLTNDGTTKMLNATNLTISGASPDTQNKRTHIHTRSCLDPLVLA